MPSKRSALVTGASKGIGRSIVIELAHRGYAVAAIARSSEALAELACHIDPENIFTLAADLRDIERIPEHVSNIHGRLGGIDLVVNCAGATKRGELFDLPHADFLEGFALKFHSSVEITRAVWTYLKASQNGHLVNIIGSSARDPAADIVIGGAVNSALENFTKAMAERGSCDGVRVNGIHPGGIDTGRLSKRIAELAAIGGIDEKSARQQLLHVNGLTRFGNPDEIARCVGFLDSSAGTGFHGALIDIDGGARRARHTEQPASPHSSDSHRPSPVADH